MRDKSEKLATISLYITNTGKKKTSYFNLYKICGMKKRKPHYSGPNDKFKDSIKKKEHIK